MKNLAVPLFIALFSASGSQAQESAPNYSEHSRLLVYREAQGTEQPVKSAGDWNIRRAHIVAGLEQAMGKHPNVSRLPPLDVRTDASSSTQRDDYTRVNVTYQVESNDRVPAYLYVPEGIAAGSRRPAMLALHPTSPLGKGVVDGQGPRRNRNYAAELAERGYVVLAPDYPSFGDYDYDFSADDYVSGSMKGIVNHRRGVDLLAARDDVDPQRIGVIGHSLGGHNAMFAGVFDDRLKVVVSSCGWTPFHDYYSGKLAGWTSDRYMPRIKDVYELDPNRVPFDFYEVVAALAPRAFFSVSPLKDHNFDVTGVKKAIPAAHEVYRLLGAADRLQVRYPDCEHDFPPAARREAYGFIDQILQHRPARDVPTPE